MNEYTHFNLIILHFFDMSNVLVRWPLTYQFGRLERLD